MNPIVSVIIPTANRPHYLPRAVDSALAEMKQSDVEVIVVPNGPDESWRDSLMPYRNNMSVRVVRIAEANANVARNTGLAEAKGEFVRFLDDDDYLIPEGAIKQYQLIQASGADLVSGNVQLVDVKGRSFDVWHQPDVDDLCVAVLAWRRCQPTAHVYRRSRLDDIKWNPSTKILQDVDWLFDLCSSRELLWKKSDDIVGIWQHHWEDRISSSRKFNDTRKLIVTMLMRTYERLQEDCRLNDARKHAIAQGLLGCVHSVFFLEPSYWCKVIKIARTIDPSARSVQKIYESSILRHLDFYLLQWFLLPKRWLFWQYRQILKERNIKYYW